MSQLPEPQELKDGDKIPFVATDSRYGRAEFVICPIWKRNRLVKVFITTAQQENARQFVVDCNSDSLSIRSWGGVKDPRMWLNGKCKEHKTYYLKVYVPEDANYLQVGIYSTFSLDFGRE